MIAEKKKLENEVEKLVNDFLTQNPIIKEIEFKLSHFYESGSEKLIKVSVKSELKIY